MTVVLSAKRYVTTLNSEERTTQETASLSNRRSIREKTRTRILLLSDTRVSREEGGSQPDTEIAVRLKVNPLTVANIRQRAHERGALSCLQRQEQKTRKALKPWLKKMEQLLRSNTCLLFIEVWQHNKDSVKAVAQLLRDMDYQPFDHPPFRDSNNRLYFNKAFPAEILRTPAVT